MRLLFFLFVLAIATHGTAFAIGQEDDSVAPAAGSSATHPAPADEYFGRLKMSILGIRNQLVHLTAQVDGNPGNAEDVMPTAALTEDSIKEWEQKYPQDPWLAKTVYMLVHLYAKVPSDAGHASAMKTLQWLVAKYPQSAFTNQALVEVGRALPASTESSASP